MISRGSESRSTVNGKVKVVLYPWHGPGCQRKRKPFDRLRWEEKRRADPISCFLRLSTCIYFSLFFFTLIDAAGPPLIMYLLLLICRRQLSLSRLGGWVSNGTYDLITHLALLHKLLFFFFYCKDYYYTLFDNFMLEFHFSTNIIYYRVEGGGIDQGYIVALARSSGWKSRGHRPLTPKKA